MKWYYKLKYFLEDFSWMKVYFSPFKIPKLKFYFGKIAIGTPYFYPRVLDKKTRMFKPKKIGFDFVGLGWKTKWEDNDYRHEWNPRWSFVLWKWQVALIFRAPDDVYDYYYWESWLYYHYSTDKNKSQRERIEQVKEEFLNHDQSDIRDEIANKLTKILKPKYL